MPLDQLSSASPSTEAAPGILTSLKELGRLAVPMIVSRAGLAAMGIADAIMVSRCNPSEFAALSLADGTLGRIVEVFAAFIIGGLVLVPRAYGTGDIPEALRIWRRSLAASIGLGLIGLLIGLLGTNVFRLLGQSAPLAAKAGTLSSVLGLGYVAALLAIGAAIFLEGIRRPVVVAVSVIAANAINIALNWLLIGGHVGFPALGALGSAISTTIVRFLLAITLVICVLTFRSAKLPPSSQEQPPNDQHSLGLSAAIVQGVMLVLTSSLLIFAGWLGSLPLAVLSAIWTLNAPVMLVALGLADATGVRVASSDGARTGLSSRSLLALSAAAALAIGLLVISLWSLLPNLLAAILTTSASMRQSLAPLIPLAGILLLLDSLSFVVVSSLRALRDIVWPTAIEIATMAALVPVAFWLAFTLSAGVKGLLMAAILSAVCRAALLAWRFAWLTRNQ